MSKNKSPIGTFFSQDPTIYRMNAILHSEDLYKHVFDNIAKYLQVLTDDDDTIYSLKPGCMDMFFDSIVQHKFNYEDMFSKISEIEIDKYLHMFNLFKLYICKEAHARWSNCFGPDHIDLVFRVGGIKFDFWNSRTGYSSILDHVSPEINELFIRMCNVANPTIREDEINSRKLSTHVNCQVLDFIFPLNSGNISIRNLLFAKFATSYISKVFVHYISTTQRVREGDCILTYRELRKLSYNNKQRSLVWELIELE